MLPTGDDWIHVGGRQLPVAEVLMRAARPDCGAVVTCCGFVRDHSGERSGVTELRYEAYDSYVIPRLAEVSRLTRARHPGVHRLALLHRTGDLSVGDLAVVVAASTPHRDEAFCAASFAIGTLKQIVPIWKRETFAGGTFWVAECSAIESDEARPLPTTREAATG